MSGLLIFRIKHLSPLVRDAMERPLHSPLPKDSKDMKLWRDGAAPAAGDANPLAVVDEGKVPPRLELYVDVGAYMVSNASLWTDEHAANEPYAPVFAFGMDPGQDGEEAVQARLQAITGEGVDLAAQPELTAAVEAGSDGFLVVSIEVGALTVATFAVASTVADLAAKIMTLTPHIVTRPLQTFVELVDLAQLPPAGESRGAI